MKKLIPIFFLFLSLSAQPVPVTITEIEYKNLPFDIRVENSGIYGIASFSVTKDLVTLISTDHTKAIEISKNGSLIERSIAPQKNEERFTSEDFQHGPRPLTDDRGGIYSDPSGRRLSLRINGRNSLVISSDLSGAGKEIRLPFKNDLAYAELIGIDASGNYFLLTERYLSDIPLKVQREVLTIDAQGNRLSLLVIPDIKYLSTEKDFRIDAEGNLYHLMTTTDRMIIFRWSGLTDTHQEKINYPAEYSYTLHYNDYVTTHEFPGEAPQQPTAVASRTLALRIGESYVMYQYVCTAANLATSDVTASDGDIVRTPPWLQTGTNARIPYKWGGFSTIAQFDAGLKSGKYAGDINTNGVSSYAVGLDCSGFVSRCWQMTYHSSTSMMPNITTQYSSWDSLKLGDAIHKIGHVRLFIERSANGGFCVVEAAARNWDVSYWTFAPSELQGVYTPRFYNSMESNFSFQRPVLSSVITLGSDSVALTWECDTTGILGYRIYSSVNGTQWNLFRNEATVGKIYRAVVPISADAEFYRMTSVKNDAAKSESDWSNAMGASRSRGAAHYLIVDGFERLNASWQNAAHTFAVRYGNALRKAGVTFSTIKNSFSTVDTASFFSHDGVIWFLGDEGLADETFSAGEQLLLRSYLQSGKKVFVTGSEVGYDLSQNGTVSDKEFFSNYLKAVYKSDNASSLAVKNSTGGFYSGNTFSIGQVYVENSPDEIDAVNGSTVSLRYDNNKGAGVQYAGTFGASQKPGKMIFLSFALETVGNDTAMNTLIKNAIDYFEGTTVPVLAQNEPNATDYRLDQNYPNPFNPSTMLRYGVPERSHVTLSIYNTLGQKISQVVNELMEAGFYEHTFDASHLSSGIYFYRIEATSEQNLSKTFVNTKKMVLVK